MADSITEYSRAVRDWLKDGLSKGLGGLLLGILYKATKTAHDQASIAAGAYGSFTIAATGVKLGDAVIWAGAKGATGCVAGLIFYGCVTADNTITVTVYNGTVGAIDMASQTFEALIIPLV